MACVARLQKNGFNQRKVAIMIYEGGKKGQIFIVDMKPKGRYTTTRNVINEDLTS